MELGADFWSSLLAIVVIDLVLAGDNAIVIGLAARRLPKEMRRKVVVWGTVGAVAIRSLLTLGVVWLLGIPGLLAAGGLMLAWIAYKLLVQQEGGHDIKAGNTLWQSVQTIIIADAAMGIDNVIAVAGAAEGELTLVILGLLISIPVVVWGSTLFIKLINRFPWIVYLGSAVLAYTAAKMITNEKKMAFVFDSGAVKYSFEAVMIVVILLAGYWSNKARANRPAPQKSRESH